MAIATVPSPRALDGADWEPRAAEHARRVDGLCREHRLRARAGERHPVLDFLFTYYSLRPGQLRRWHPGLGLALTGPSAAERRSWHWYTEVAARDESGRAVSAVGLDPAAYLADRRSLVELVLGLLGATAERPAFTGCFGLHEWAMVYREPPSGIRHESWPLRLGSAGTDEVVEGHQVRCSHYDAYRFFAPDALSRNAIRPSRERQVELEQPGCLHANMELYNREHTCTPSRTRRRAARAKPLSEKNQRRVSFARLYCTPKHGGPGALPLFRVRELQRHQEDTHRFSLA
jgi:hypothetical protein